MYRPQFLTTVISVALLVGAVSCTTSSPQSSGENSSSTQAAQNLDESADETPEEKPEAEAEESTVDAEKQKPEAIRAVGDTDGNGTTVEGPGHMPVVPGKVSVDGELEERMVKRVMRKYRRGIQFCYKQSLKEQPAAGGQAVVESIVAADGSVESARIAEGELPETGLGECVLSKMKHWTYPETADGESATVRIPWHFHPPETSEK